MATARNVELQIYVFGASSGESIVLELAKDNWAVIDCFAGSPNDASTNPVHTFLSSKKVKNLEFVCLTHPHADHFMGMSHLIRDFHINTFWSFGGLNPPDFDLLKTFFQADAATSGLPDSRDRANEISRIFDEIRSKGIRHEIVGPKTLVYPSSIDTKSDIRIWGLAPSGRHTHDYKVQLLRSTKGKQFKSALPKSDHNLISSAFLIEFNRTRIVLGGDVEKEGWQDILINAPVADLSSHAVKIPHHGSRNGYCPNLWDRFAAGGKPVAILTPFAPKFLPEKVALDHIRQNACALHSAAALQHSPKSFPTSSNPRLARIRSALATKARARRLDTTRAGGYCHLTFDDQGHYRVRHSGDAARIA